MRILAKSKITLSVLGLLAASMLFPGCFSGGGSDTKSEILKVLQSEYPPNKKAGSETSAYKLFKFEALKDKGEGVEEAWCVNFLFTNKVDASSKPARWIGFGNVVKKDGKYSYESSTGCKLSENEQKKIFELKNAG